MTTYLHHISSRQVLVLGGTGKSGRRVAQRLRERDLPIRIGTPSGHPPFDWNDEATWPPALRNINSVYLTYYPDLAVPEAAAAVGSFAELAVATGARRLVLLSGRGEVGAQRGEQVVRDSGADWTIVRSRLRLSVGNLRTRRFQSLCTACNLCRASETCAELRERSDGSRSTSRE